MSLIAKFASICPRCNQDIKPGDKIIKRYTRPQAHEKARHTNCKAARMKIIKVLKGCATTKGRG